MTVNDHDGSTDEVVTKLLYISPDSKDVHDRNDTVPGSLYNLPHAQLCPGNEALQKLMQQFRQELVEATFKVACGSPVEATRSWGCLSAANAGPDRTYDAYTPGEYFDGLVYLENSPAMTPIFRPSCTP